ncbi:MAG: hypothetical protein ACJA1I_002619 [Zhongshania marina]|jgi:hypothetical protein
MIDNADNYLDELCFQILEVLKEKDRPMGTAAFAETLGLRHDGVQAAVCKLIIRDQIIMVGRCKNERPVYVLRVKEGGKVS